MMSNHVLLITRAGATDALRWARQHLYALLVLTPLVAGMTYFGVARLVEDSAWRPSAEQATALSILAAACLVVLSMSRASAEIYHLRRPESVFDTLPVSENALIAAALARRVAANLGVGVILLVARALAGGAANDSAGGVGSSSGGALVSTAALLLFVLLMSAAEAFAALEWIHWGHRRERAHAALALALVAASSVIAGLLVLTVVKPEMTSVGARAAAFAAGATLTIALTALVVFLHGRWRAGDIEYAKRLGSRDRWGLAVESLSRRLGDAPVAAQLARDLRLTLRGFSSAVYASAGVAALWLVVLAALLGSGALSVEAGETTWFRATWLPQLMAVKFASVLSMVSLSALVPVMVAHQTPHLWLERTVGARGPELLRAKLYYARSLLLPAAASGWLVGLASGAIPAFYALPLLLELLWLWWLVGTLAGGLAFELPEQPGLAIVLIACVGSAAGGFVAFLWPAGLALYALGVPQLLMRGEHRAHLHLRGEAS